MGEDNRLGAAKPGQKNASLHRSGQQLLRWLYQLWSHIYRLLFSITVKICCSRLFVAEFPLLLVTLRSSVFIQISSVWAKERWLKKNHPKTSLLYSSPLLLFRHGRKPFQNIVSTTSLYFTSFHKSFLCHKSCKNTNSPQDLAVLKLLAIILTMTLFPHAFLPAVHSYCSVFEKDPIVVCLYLVTINKACSFL